MRESSDKFNDPKYELYDIYNLFYEFNILCMNIKYKEYSRLKLLSYYILNIMQSFIKLYNSFYYSSYIIRIPYIIFPVDYGDPYESGLYTIIHKIDSTFKS